MGRTGFTLLRQARRWFRFQLLASDRSSVNPIVRPHGRHRGGFTLIEALLVISIMGLLSAMTVPKMAAIITEQRLNRAAWALGNQLQVAFGLALRDRKPIQITFDSSHAQLTIADRAGNVFTSTGLDAFNFNASNVALSRSTDEVYPEGLAQDSLVITLSANSTGSTFTRRVRMTRGGLVQIR
jgi:type II secretion system protein H